MNTAESHVQLDHGADRSSRWRATVAAASAILLSLLFLASGVWKLADLDATVQRMVQSLVPPALSLPAALAVAIAETLSAILLLFPRYRRWGAWLAGLMLLAFMIYIGVLYERLIGEDCNCFPWIRRVVGPAFFAGDMGMLALAFLAAWWSKKSHGWRGVAAITAGICIAAGTSYGVAAYRHSTADVPETAMVDNGSVNLRQGRVLLYFFDPECSHCYQVAKEMSSWNWGSTRIVVMATSQEQFAVNFLRKTTLRALISSDTESLRKRFPFTDPPYAVALDNGRAVARFHSGDMEGERYHRDLLSLGHVKSECRPASGAD
jgi:uncharacterized membrane protein YphA (DoxX/SURF4 family)